MCSCQTLIVEIVYNLKQNNKKKQDPDTGIVV